MLLAALALFIGGMAVSIGAPFEAREARVLADRGIEATAIITDVSIRSAGRGREDHAVVDVEYEDELGLSTEAFGIDYCNDAADIGIGNEIEVTFDPDGVAPTQFTTCPQSQNITIPLAIGVVAMGAGTLLILRSWWRTGWRRRWFGVPLIILGILFTGTSFDDDCTCQEMAYTGGALVLLGTTPLIAPRKPADP